MSLREHYDETLEDIRRDILRMGNLAAEMVRLSVDSVLTGDLATSNHVISMDDEVDRLEEDITRRTIMVVATQSPVASDLRFLIATLGVVGEIEKVGDHAVKLARRATKLTGFFPPEFRRSLTEVSEMARNTFAASLRLYAVFDKDLAQAIIEADNDVDEVYLDARHRLLEMTKDRPEDTEHLARTIEAFHALEHVGDHAEEIAHRMTLCFTGERKPDA